MNFDLMYMFKLIPPIMAYLPITLLISGASIIAATLLGLLLALMLRGGKISAAIARVYISFFRGTPVLVQLLIIYFGLPQLFPVLNSIGPVYAVIAGLSFNTAAYLAEIFRAGIDSVDRGQIEAALASGLSLPIACWRILLPQICRNAIPATGNMYIGLIKNSSLAFTLGVTELLSAGKLEATSSLKFFEAYTAVALVYWGLTFILSQLQRLVENQLGKPYQH